MPLNMDDPDCQSEKQPLLDNAHNDVHSCIAEKNMRTSSGEFSANDAVMSDPSAPVASSFMPSSPNGLANGGGSGSGQGIFTYEELSSGFTCPTCHGHGKIPRGKEADLVALIPYNDARLKPRRTYLYVIGSILACAIVAGVLCAFLLPRPIAMAIVRVETLGVTINTTTSNMQLLLRADFTVSNKNFVSAYGQNVTVTAYWSELVKGANTTALPVTVPGRQTNSDIYANVTATFTESFLVDYCSSSSATHIIYMQFIATLQFKLLSQSQQATTTYYSPVRCAMLDTMPRQQLY